MKRKKVDLKIHKLSQSIIKGGTLDGVPAGFTPCTCPPGWPPPCSAPDDLEEYGGAAGEVNSSVMSRCTPESYAYALKAQGGGPKCSNSYCCYCPTGTPHNFIVRTRR